MSAEYTIVAVLVSSPCVIVAVHMLAARIAPGKLPPQALAAAACVLGSVPVLMAIVALTPPGAGLFGSRVAACWFALAVYMLIAYSYFHIFNMSETARRVRILYEISSRGTAGVEELRAAYGGARIIEVRLERLQETGQIAQAGGRYTIRNPLLYTAARIIDAWRVLLRL
ncbi:MAG: hypothetical protein WCG78_03105 [Candidatus Omnitrophota bacterium]